MNAVEIAAAVGAPYTVERSGRLVRLRRVTATGRTVTVVFGEAEARAVADALHDILESA